MYVCVCKAIRKSDLEEILSQGERDLDSVGKKCGAGTDCGACVDRIEKMIQSEQAPKSEKKN